MGLGMPWQLRHISGTHAMESIPSHCIVRRPCLPHCHDSLAGFQWILNSPWLDTRPRDDTRWCGPSSKVAGWKKSIDSIRPLPVASLRDCSFVARSSEWCRKNPWLEARQVVKGWGWILQALPADSQQDTSWLYVIIQWSGWRENLPETTSFPGCFAIYWVFL